ncbi:unnamed protein product [Rhizoctonia solani]|uniref:Uncharacterized protein n=1 Tax=Rhizoctonia solani TaxID=456999 RepID=A0A8H3BGY0_9AGAM|nr:unnamed protein product [Rhizoctonia solani]
MQLTRGLKNHETNTLYTFFYIWANPCIPAYNPFLPMFGRWKLHRSTAICGQKALANSVLQALTLASGIATAIARPDFILVSGEASPEPASEAPLPSPPPSPPLSSPRQEKPMSWQLLSPINTRVSLPPIQVPQLDNSSDPVTPISDELKTPSSAYGHGVLVSPILESPINERIQAYINAYISAIPIENMRILETILEDEDDNDDSDAESEHTIVPRDKDKIPDTPVTQSSIYSFHTANASIPTSPASFFEHDWKRR